MTDKERYLLNTNQRLEAIIKSLKTTTAELRRITLEINSTGKEPSPEFVERYNQEVVPLMQSFKEIDL
ncbi:hypothetical protein ABDK00_006745 [Niabella insulamsoli]|uniref:hypothetical protein n=1 Tax=Niabella insulamsoli TaxID=3144874 RepID=UPI0031FD1E9B